MEDHVNDVLHKFILTDRLHHTLLDKNVAKAGLHRSQHHILLYLSRADHALTQKELADAFEVSSAAMTNVLKKLEQSGYILRCSGKEDQRCNEITVTQKGLTHLALAHDYVQEIDSTMFCGFSDKELESFSIYLDKIKANLDRLAETIKE